MRHANEVAVVNTELNGEINEVVGVESNDDIQLQKNVEEQTRYRRYRTSQHDGPWSGYCSKIQKL